MLRLVVTQKNRESLLPKHSRYVSEDETFVRSPHWQPIWNGLTVALAYLPVSYTHLTLPTTAEV